MKRIVLLLIISFSIGINIIAQEQTENTGSIRILNHPTERSVTNYLLKQRALIRILLTMDCKFLNDSLFIKKQPIDSIKKIEIFEHTFQTVDSIIIILDNGITWNLNNDPPPIKPKRFRLKMRSKKWRDNQAVIDRVKFLEFCSQFDNSNNNPCTVNDTYIAYTQITYSGKTVFMAVYEIDSKARPMRFDLIHLDEIENGVEMIIKQSTQR